MNTDNTDLRFARTCMWVAIAMTLVFLAVAVGMGIYIIHPGEHFEAGVTDGPKAWGGYGLVLLLGLGIGASVFATFVFATFYRRLKARQLKVADGTVDGK